MLLEKRVSEYDCVSRVNTLFLRKYYCHCVVAGTMTIFLHDIRTITEFINNKSINCRKTSGERILISTEKDEEELKLFYMLYKNIDMFIMYTQSLRKYVTF